MTRPASRPDRRRRASRLGRIAAATILFAVPAMAATQAPRLVAPNVVDVSPSLVTSGQPTADALADLKALGFDAVIYLAPPTVSDAVRDEPLIVARQGLVFVNIPIRFDDPSDADVDTFAAVLRALGPRKVLVHCQVNFRASALVFLYRTTVLGEAPRAAYEALSGVWVPHGAWRKLIDRRLRERGIEFDLL
ncbi:MAG: protein tyrosine phosphatase family protein [Burkholderiales bacterium]